LNTTQKPALQTRGRVTPQDVAAQWAKLFVTKTRADGSEFISLDLPLDGHRHPLQQAVRAAHDGRTPDDHVYAACGDACQALADAVDSPDAFDDVRLEAAPYFATILTWLGSNLLNIEYLGQAAKEYGAQDGGQLLTYAHDAFLNDILASMRQSVVEEAKRINESQDNE
jgi:hypothetical protein